MPWIKITRHARDALRAAAVNRFQDDSRPVPGEPDMVEAPISDETFELLQRMRAQGETFSDTILRGLNAMAGRKPN